MPSTGQGNREGDNPKLTAYGQAMERGHPYIRLKLEVPDAIELGAFVGAFTAIASEYDRFVRAENNNRPSDATLYVSEVRKGSIIADLLPYAGMFSDLAVFAGQAVDLEEFVLRYGRRIGLFGGGKPPPEDITKAELKDYYEQVAAIANTPGSHLEVSAIEIERGEHKVRAAFKFDTSQAREIQDKIEVVRQRLDHTSRADHSRVLLVFTRSDVRTSPVGKRSGEQVVIEAISDKPRPLIYASDLAEEQIKHEINEADDNIYKKGFVVDVNVETRAGKPVAYAVTHLHSVVDLPDDDED